MVYLNVKSDPFFVYKKCMRLLGIWPLDNQRRISEIIFWVTTFVQIVVLIIRLINPLGKCPTYEFGSIDYKVTGWNILSVTVKLCCRLTGDRMTFLIESTIDDWSSITDPAEREIMEWHDKCGSAFFGFQAGIYVLTIARKLISLIFVNAMPPLNIQETCVFDDNSPWTTVAPVLSLIALSINSLMHFSTTALFWTFAMHLSAQYKILKGRFRDMLLIVDKKESRRVLRRLVDRHNELFVLSRDYESSFNVYITMVVLFDQAYVCMCTVLMIADIITLNFFDEVYNLWLLAVVLGDLAMHHYNGQYLTDCCEEVGEVFGQCRWYDLSKEFRTNYNIVLSRCQMPTQLTTMKIYKLNLYNFKYCLKALFSYISLMVAITTRR